MVVPPTMVHDTQPNHTHVEHGRGHVLGYYGPINAKVS